MSFLDAFEVSTRADPDLAEKTVPRGFGERFDLEWKAARAPDKWGYYESRMRDLWDDALERLNKATGQRLTNPFALPPENLTRFDLGGPGPAAAIRTIFGTREKAMGAATDAFDEALAGQHDLPNPRLFEDKIRAEATKLRQDAAQAALAGYGASGLGAFLGAASGELSHPVNLATLPIGGAYASANIARVGLLRYIGRAALAESAVAAASQTAIEIADAPYQERLGTDTGIEDRLERIFIAGAGGAIFGMGLSGLVAAARGLRKKLSPTLDEADALKFAERASLHEGKNPLGPDGVTAHARAVETAERQVASGRHADVEQIVREEVRGRAGKLIPDIRPRSASENVDEVLDATFKYGARGGNKTMPIEQLTGGYVGTPTKVDALIEKLSKPDAKLSRLIVDGEGNVIEGQHRFAALQRMGVKNVPVTVIRDLARGMDIETVEAAVKAAGKLHPDQVRDVVKNALEMVDEAGSATNALATYDLPKGFEQFYRAALEKLGASALPATSAKPFDILDPSTITRAIADSAPPVPEKAAATAKAEMDLANAKAIAEDPTPGKIKVNEEGEAMSAKEALDASSEAVKEANFFVNCAMGIAIG